MKTSFKTGLRRALKSAGVGATVAVAIGFASVGAANADTFVPLEDGSISQTLPGGITVTVTRTDEKANISPSMGATPLHRNYNTFKGATGSVTWGDSTLGVTGCAGYAQARSYVKVTVDTPNATQQVTL